MDFNADHFSLFELPRSFRLDPMTLEKRYREIQTRVHPDRFAHAGDTERRLSLQWATRVNEAYRTLRRPLPRAQYLLSLAGHDISAENNNSMPPEFLIEQMEWREAVAEARVAHDANGLGELHQRVKQLMNDRYEQLADSLDDHSDYPLAADRVRRLMFLDKLLHDIDDALAALDD